MGSLYDLLKQRRMVRHYTGERVTRETLERIAATVRRAPSGGFSQGQRLLVVDDPELLAAIAALGDDPPLEGVEPWLETAAAQVFVMTRENDYHERYHRDDKLQDGEEIEWPVPFWHVDAGAAMMLVLLAAIEEGLAAAVYGIFGDDERKVDAASPFLDELTRGRVAIAVGRLAASVLEAPYVRHPSHGGAAEFEAGLRRSFATIRRRRAPVRRFL
jgi:nitroreductase